MLGIAKRTCHFVNDRGKKKSLYLALVGSYFEHCSCVWRPVNNTDITKFESLQKRAIFKLLSRLRLIFVLRLIAMNC